jgi:Uma2 family endonuclease
MTTAIATPTLNILPNIWTSATWAEFVRITEYPDYQKAKFSYYRGSYYIEIGIGADHAFNDALITFLVSLYCMSQNIPVKGFTNCSYRKQGIRECQPDISYYLGDRIPQGSSVVDLDLVPPPDLVIEVADTSIASDLGMKRLLYEEMGVSEYWVVDVRELKITAFRILSNCGSDRLSTSQVITGLSLTLLEEALHHSREVDNSQVGTWFLAQIQSAGQSI